MAFIAFLTGLYGIKITAFRLVESRIRITAIVVAPMLAAVPIFWMTSPDWNYPYVSRMGVLIGEPAHFLAVPLLSLIVDLIRPRSAANRYWYFRIPLEWFVAIPLWMFVWGSIECYILGWVFI